MKVYVVTTAKPFCGEKIYKAFPTLKAAEKEMRKTYPHMRKDDTILLDTDNTMHSYSSDNTGSYLIFIYEMTVGA